MLRAIRFLHDNGCTHRDIKPENFLFENTQPDAEIKLIDFGLSCKYKTKETKKTMHSVVGTPNYVAPEVLKGSYGTSCDLWSVGVILYLVLCGMYPFEGRTNAVVFRRILDGVINKKESKWNVLSSKA